jgi:hypothetical protein
VQKTSIAEAIDSFVNTQQAKDLLRLMRKRQSVKVHSPLFCPERLGYFEEKNG